MEMMLRKLKLWNARCAEKWRHETISLTPTRIRYSMSVTIADTCVRLSIRVGMWNGFDRKRDVCALSLKSHLEPPRVLVRVHQPKEWWIVLARPKMSQFRQFQWEQLQPESSLLESGFACLHPLRKEPYLLSLIRVMCLIIPTTNTKIFSPHCALRLRLCLMEKENSWTLVLLSHRHRRHWSSAVVTPYMETVLVYISCMSKRSISSFQCCPSEHSWQFESSFFVLVVFLLFVQ